MLDVVPKSVVNASKNKILWMTIRNQHIAGAYFDSSRINWPKVGFC